MSTLKISAKQNEVNCTSKYIPCELYFRSALLDETYKASQIANLSEQTISELISETSEIMASVAAVKESAETKIMANEFVDLEWLKRVRLRYNKVSNFRKLLLRELDTRTGLEGKEKAVRAIKKEKASLDAHKEHQQKLKNYEFEKRKFFYALVSQRVGANIFAEMMAQAEEMAQHIAPRP